MSFAAVEPRGGDFTQAAAVLLGLGGGFVLIGLVAIVLVVRRRAATRRATRHAWGRVVAMDARRQVIAQPGEIFSPVHLYPTVVFVDDAGRERVFQSRAGFSWQRYHAGQVVPVRYDPANPDVVRIGSADIIGWVGLAVGALVAFIGLMLCLGGILALGPLSG